MFELPRFQEKMPTQCNCYNCRMVEIQISVISKRNQNSICEVLGWWIDIGSKLASQIQNWGAITLH